MMAERPTTIDEFVEAYSDYLDELRNDAPSTDDLSVQDRAVAEGWLASLRSLEGVDPLVSLPSPESLLIRADVVRRRWFREDLADELRVTLRSSGWPDAHVIVNERETSSATGWDLLVTVEGVLLRIVVAMGDGTPAEAFDRHVQEIAAIFGAFPAETAVMLVAANDEIVEAVIVDRAHVTAAFESPSGEYVPPRLDGIAGSPDQMCRRFLEGTILEFDEPPTPAVASIPELVELISPDAVATQAMEKVSEAGRRARIVEKSSGYGALGEAQTVALARLVGRAAKGRLDDIDSELATVGDAA